jgi:hyperosmotically inducible protein
MRARALLVILVVACTACSGKTRITSSTTLTSDALESTRLAARVKTALLNDPVVGARRIDVHVTGMDVRLTGRVASEAERDRALQVARGVEGVRGVTSSLEIKP